MPLYEYQCNSCGHRFEMIQRFSDPLAADCPLCGGPVQKLLSAPAIQFKGTGWYITDYARRGNGSSADGAGKPAAGSKATEPKNEKKPTEAAAAAKEA
ncbi:MAG: FmdB family zinc ribbon protein [Vicinamibacterales bacterium]